MYAPSALLFLNYSRFFSRCMNTTLKTTTLATGHCFDLLPGFSFYSHKIDLCANVFFSPLLVLYSPNLFLFFIRFLHRLRLGLVHLPPVIVVDLKSG